MQNTVMHKNGLILLVGKTLLVTRELSFLASLSTSGNHKIDNVNTLKVHHYEICEYLMISIQPHVLGVYRAGCVMHRQA